MKQEVVNIFTFLTEHPSLLQSEKPNNYSLRECHCQYFAGIVIR